jgi:hypothetical protein
MKDSRNYFLMRGASSHVSTLLPKGSVHEDPSSWCLLGFIPDVEKTSSAKKQHEAQQKYEKGRNQCNYHSCLKEILKPVEQSMNQRGLNGYVHQVDKLSSGPGQW